MLPWKLLKVETKICAIWGVLETNLKKSWTLKFTMNIRSLLSICIHRCIIFIFTEKKSTLVDFFPLQKIFCSAIFYFYFRENPRFRDEFQALLVRLTLRSSRCLSYSHTTSLPDHGGGCVYLLNHTKKTENKSVYKNINDRTWKRRIANDIQSLYHIQQFNRQQCCIIW